MAYDMKKAAKALAAAKIRAMTTGGAIDGTAGSDASNYRGQPSLGTAAKSGKQPPGPKNDGAAPKPRVDKKPRPGFKRGGAVNGKGKTNINIVIAPQGGAAGGPGAGGMPVPPPLPPSAVSAPPGPPPGPPGGGMPPGLAAALAGGGAGGPPMMPPGQKRGGRIGYATGGAVRHGQRKGYADGGAVADPSKNPKPKDMTGGLSPGPASLDTHGTRAARAKGGKVPVKPKGKFATVMPADADGDGMKKGGKVKKAAGGRIAKAGGGELSPFGAAFAAARSRGDKTFMFKGKSYNTKRADDTIPMPQPRPADVGTPAAAEPPAQTPTQGTADRNSSPLDEQGPPMPTWRQKLGDIIGIRGRPNPSVARAAPAAPAAPADSSQPKADEGDTTSPPPMLKKGGKVTKPEAKATGGAASSNMARRFVKSPTGKAGARSGVGRLNQTKAYNMPSDTDNNGV